MPDYTIVNLREVVEDEIVELGTWDAIRLPPALRRGVEAGPDGAEQLPDFWTD